jgi:hypothetical protein
MFNRACGRQLAANLTRGDIVRLLNVYIQRPATHRQLQGTINRLYAWAKRLEIVPSNPADDIETTTAPARERVLSLQELVAIWRGGTARPVVTATSCI